MKGKELASRGDYMRWPVNHEQSEYMRKLQREARMPGRSHESENWADGILRTGCLKWTRKAIWGCRLFNFWNARKGVAIELDGPKPDAGDEEDRHARERSGIAVYRVKSFDESQLRSAMSKAECLEDWGIRRDRLGIPSKLKGKNIPKAHGNWVPPGSGEHIAQPSEHRVLALAT
jgi:hypothetical protein